jgi:hypothetical protein
MPDFTAKSRGIGIIREWVRYCQCCYQIVTSYFPFLALRRVAFVFGALELLS